MKARRYSDTQVLSSLKQVVSGSQAVDVARKYGVSPAIIHCWKNRYRWMTLPELNKLED